MPKSRLHTVGDLPAPLNGAITADLIVFDGECVLCSGFFRFMLRHDRKGRFRYALAQSDLGARLYQTLGLPTDDFETNLVIIDGQIYQKLDAFAHAMRAIGWPWRLLSCLRFLPALIKDPAYNAIARNRYSLFGRSQACMIPDAPLQARFLPGGWQ